MDQSLSLLEFIIYGIQYNSSLHFLLETREEKPEILCMHERAVVVVSKNLPRLCKAVPVY